MPDMLVKLYDLPSFREQEVKLNEQGIMIRRPISPEKTAIVEWVRTHFGNHWASECDVAFGRTPISCYVATRGQEILGFACYDVTCKAFFGPTGVAESTRGLGVGKVLLIKSMEGLRELGYGYSIIGDAGPVDFYSKLLGAMPIPDSTPGVYKDMI
ncbi:MAG: GNAT family N-acetyltransferase [Cellulosilyticaceae bacterium]